MLEEIHCLVAMINASLLFYTVFKCSVGFFYFTVNLTKYDTTINNSNFYDQLGFFNGLSYI